MNGKLNGKIALVTGGTSGIGLATAKRFAAEGAQVYVTGRRESELARAEKEIPGVIAIRHDATDLVELERVYARIRETHGRLDVIFANAGGGELLPLANLTEAHFDATFSRNVKALVFTVQKALPLLANGASIILAGSTAGSVGTAGFSVYAASKAAVRSFARNWILELKDRGIRVNTLSPGPVKTPGLVDLVGPDAAQQQALLDHLATKVPLGRVGEPNEIAAAALFLASDESSFVNGTELFVDGGEAQV